jgi:hypothetical protein
MIVCEEDVIAEKLAVTVIAADITKTHLPVPEHPPPDQPANVEFPSGVTLSVTIEPASYPFVQVVPHVMPEGDEVTVPEPVPLLFTVRL